jgi:hypothetical protein
MSLELNSLTIEIASKDICFFTLQTMRGREGDRDRDKEANLIKRSLKKKKLPNESLKTHLR